MRPAEEKVSVLTRGDLLAELVEPTGPVVRWGWRRQGSAEAIVPVEEPGDGEGPNVKWRRSLGEFGK